ncbi:MAG: ABC transporter ATP-binding protein [Proteobacteria bacterium]|nr:ABC transporter ATP-binding protein [Pseudomonadota bacterium]MYJ95365.1 ABC transporter ATP-binding protein [Pseudomonadota bacterium]
MRRTRVARAAGSGGADTGPVVRIRDLTVDFDTAEGRIRAVDGVSLDILPRRTLGVVGESGCGKSVTAQAIMRIEDKRICTLGGRILLRRGRDTLDLLSLKGTGARMRELRGREIGLVFQEPMTSFSPVHTIGNQIVEAVRLHFDLTRAEAVERAIEQLRHVGMPHPEHIMNRYAWELSGGLRQRAMIAMALICAPGLLIADEPTTALDVTTQAQVLALLDELQDRHGMALMLITHDLGVVAAVADDVAIMYLGTVVECGPAASIFREPGHPYTQLLLDSLPSLSRRRRGALKAISGTVPRARNRPGGCPFHTRCPSAIAGVCDRVMPAPTQVAERHVVHCHLHDRP